MCSEREEWNGGPSEFGLIEASGAIADQMAHLRDLVDIPLVPLLATSVEFDFSGSC